MQRSNQITNALVHVCVGIAGGLLLLLTAGSKLVGQAGHHTGKVPKTHNSSGIPQMLPDAHVGSTVNTLWDIMGIVIVLVGIAAIVIGIMGVHKLIEAVDMSSRAREKPSPIPQRKPVAEELSVLEIPEGLATDLQLPWLQDLRQQLQGMKSPEAARMRKEVERRIELVRLAALQRDLEAVTELQDEGLAAQARTYEELRSAKTDPEPEPPASV
jgi:hypothetical protein